MALIQGRNGQGKSNLLEAMYILAIAKSPKASSDREMVRRQAVPDEESYSRAAGLIERSGERVRVQIDFRGLPPASGDSGTSDDLTVRKYIRVNGVPRRAAELVGQVNMVMFSADDLELVFGSPSVRRRYLDILISQLDHQYLRALQKYQRVVLQRNSLLRRIREGSSRAQELEFWDDELVSEGKQIMIRRVETIAHLSETAGPVHHQLSGNGEELKLLYRPNVELEADTTEEAIAKSINESIQSRRGRELGQGVSVTGPHRDDLQMLIDGMDAGAYASRGQARTVVLAMKLAEAQHLKEQRRDEPILLLDDILSELDAVRRRRVLDSVQAYQQSIITTAELEAVDDHFRKGMTKFKVENGEVTRQDF